MPRGLKVSCPLFANVILFVNISNLFKCKETYIMIFREAHWDTLDDSLVLWYARQQGKISFSVLMTSVMLTFWYARGRYS